MFTGIIDHCGVILKTELSAAGLKLWISTQFSDVELGESIAVNGICLTVTEFISNEKNQKVFSCDISPETLQVTTAKNFKENQWVNLERALQLSSRIGGHFVSGHVDKICMVKTISSNNDFVEMIFTGLTSDDRRLVIKKGSIAVNGVSLTINEVTNNEFNVMLIPHTLQRTQLMHLKEKDAVNIEFDMIARIVAEQAQVIKNVSVNHE